MSPPFDPEQRGRAGGAPVERALVLRATPWRETDLLVDFLGRTRGRFTVVARAARKSVRRFGGALEPGTRLDTRLSVGRGPPALGECDVVAALDAVRGDLERIHHAAYVLEITRLCSRESQGDPALYDLVCGYLEVLESAPAALEGLLAWQLAVLAHLGYRLRLDVCVRGGARPDGLSLSAGGAVERRFARVPDALPVSATALATLHRLSQGDATARLGTGEGATVVAAFAGLWRGVTGQTLRSARFLEVEPEAESGAPEPEDPPLG